MFRWCICEWIYVILSCFSPGLRWGLWLPSWAFRGLTSILSWSVTSFLVFLTYLNLPRLSSSPKSSRPQSWLTCSRASRRTVARVATGEASRLREECPGCPCDTMGDLPPCSNGMDLSWGGGRRGAGRGEVVFIITITCFFLQVRPMVIWVV